MVTYYIMSFKFMCLCDVMYSVDNYTDAFILKNKFRELLFTCIQERGDNEKANWFIWWRFRDNH